MTGRKQTKRFQGWIGLLPLILTLACAGGMKIEDTSPGPVLPDSEVGLSHGSVFDSPSPEPIVENSAEPGETPLLPRSHSSGPPVIPHRIDDFLPITREGNFCLDCHQVEEKIDGEPTPIPESHYVDLRNAPGVVGESPAGARFNCTACHLVLTDAPPLVGNQFQN